MNLIEPSFDPTVFTKNRQRLLEHQVGQAVFDEVVAEAYGRGLLSDEHFTMDGSLIEAAASLKSFKPRDGTPPSETDDDPGNPSVDFHGDKRSNATHQSATDSEARERGFHPKTLGTDKSYDTRDCVAAMREQGVTPHVVVGDPRCEITRALTLDQILENIARTGGTVWTGAATCA